jgi:hypothetical protein
MRRHLTLVLATLGLSAAAFAQNPITADSHYQVGYAVNLNIGDSALNLSNSGAVAGFTAPLGAGNICVNVYVFDPQEEEIACCSCLVTPNGLNSLSATADFTSNPLTPAVPTSIVIKLVATLPTAAPVTGTFTVCNPSVMGTGTTGLLAWGTTLEPASTPGTYAPVTVHYIPSTLSAGTATSEYTALTSTCGFIQADGTGFGICKSCATGGLAGAKK